MSKIVYANKMQYEMLKTDSRIAVVTPQPGAGSTMGLLLKAHQQASEGKTVSYFVNSKINISRPGGIKEQFFKLLKDEDIRYSEMSMIATYPYGGKIKFIGCNETEVEKTLGLSPEYMLFDNGCCNKFIQRNLFRANRAIVVDSISNIKRHGSWASELGLLEYSGGEILGFIEGIEHITGTVYDNFLFIQKEEYLRHALSSIPAEKMIVEFGKGDASG